MTTGMSRTAIDDPPSLNNSRKPIGSSYKTLPIEALEPRVVSEGRTGFEPSRKCADEARHEVPMADKMAVALGSESVTIIDRM